MAFATHDRHWLADAVSAGRVIDAFAATRDATAVLVRVRRQSGTASSNSAAQSALLARQALSGTIAGDRTPPPGSAGT